MPKKKKSPFSYKNQIQTDILNLIDSNPSQSFNYKQVSDSLGIKDKEKRILIFEILNQLSDDDIVRQVSTGKFKSKSGKNRSLVEGIIDTTSRGSGYLLSENNTPDIFISQNNLNRALNGDRVRVKILHTRKNKIEGAVVEIIEHGNKILVGTLEVNEKYSFLVPDNPKIDIDVFIPNSRLNGGKTGQKAIVKLLEWPENAKNPFGEVIEILGRPETNDAEMKSILISYGIPYDFPEAVMNEANRIDITLSKKEIENRKDFREVTTLTIDPIDAKDYDDAISVKVIGENKFEIGVHIADVAHYVTEGSELDKEAHKRGNSVYLVDRVIPMLPEHLSNGVCSLRPNEEKFTFSAVFELDEKGNILKEWFGKTVIISDRRFAYEEAQEIIEKREGEYKDELILLDSIAKHLREKRLKKGALEIESEELRFELDEEGNPIKAYKKISKDANKLVEEFMLLANKRVAEFVGGFNNKKSNLSFVYRVHDTPDESKVELFKVFISKFKKDFHYSHPKEIALQMNELFKEVKNEPEYGLIQTMAIRTMAKAVYDTNNIGHYGLGFTYYTHFTSPIRRYADLIVHRVLFDVLEKKNKNYSGLTEIAKHISQTERRAVNAERDSQKYFQAFYVKDKIGQIFNGRISGLTDWGIYVEMDDIHCEGMVTLKSINFDRFYFDEKTFAIKGQKTGFEYNLGDQVVVKISKVNLSKKQIDLTIIEEGR